MNNIQNLLRRAALGLCLCVFSAAIALGQTETTSRTQFDLYGLQALGSSQSLQVAVVNQRLSDSEIVPRIRIRIVFEVYTADAATNNLRFVRRVEREFELDGGGAATFDYTASRSGEYVNASVFARPATDSTEIVPARIVSTVLLRESGRTLLNIPSVIKGFDPQPDPPKQ